MDKENSNSEKEQPTIAHLYTEDNNKETSKLTKTLLKKIIIPGNSHYTVMHDDSIYSGAKNFDKEKEFTKDEYQLFLK